MKSSFFDPVTLKSSICRKGLKPFYLNNCLSASVKPIVPCLLLSIAFGKNVPVKYYLLFFKSHCCHSSHTYNTSETDLG